MARTRFSLPFFRLSQRLQLERVLPRKFLGRARTLLSRAGSRPQMPEEARDWLRRHYAPHNERLSEWLDRDLSQWNR